MEHAAVSRRPLKRQQLLHRITVSCFKKCVNKPGASLLRAEEHCLLQCMERFMDSLKLVSRTYNRRLARERGKPWRYAGKIK
ncbi:maker264 [Drosophila busckii]|uniref:Mitochondrial import inner membrane translocase subunit n=1 Tax=Drosophila busckii TaxID=30019 RepID=A0A0M4ETE2_DROBS|nr:maker264 [Drosophila busckii]